MGFIKDIRFSVGFGLSNSKTLLSLIRMFDDPTTRSITSTDTDLCIEGFQRSANTYFTYLVQSRNRAIKIAHHTHGAGNVLRALELGVPTIVLIRDPLDAVTSLILQNEGLGIRAGLKHYINFYGKLLVYKDQFVIGEFEEAVKTPEVLVNRLNQKYGTSFTLGPLTTQQKEEAFEKIGNLNRLKTLTESSSLLPNELKEERKPEIRRKIPYHRLLHSSKSVYAEFTYS